MSIQNRESFLNNVADQLGRKRRSKGVTRPQYSVEPQWRVFEGATQDELIDKLEDQCRVIHTHFKRSTMDTLTEVISQSIEENDGHAVVAADDKRNDEYGLTSFYENLHDEGVAFHLWDPSKGRENIQFAERADVGITFSDITLAESGTVTLFNHQGNGRSISLLPRTYIAIIPKSTLVPRMSQAVRHIHKAHADGVDVSSCVSFITGPSNSADIEMNLIVGVHGPVKATYIVVEDM
ncbi:LutC/YkgG family protein [Pontibacillus salipaludis]|uniref:Lactate utilization protein C n=1 Tax=Pontibacillus salipaludis TaxID=1697394 RepID=A0ABQ1PSF2_9BACI|nr:lactate utilization protein C [Pontibacillus salipaludis]GGD01992.1 lactate utilization protein C [Pontibacillus salipaludis]